MAVPTPVRLNAALWSVLRDGPASPYARWFDVDWAAQRPRRADAGARRAHRRRCSPTASSTVDRTGDEPVLRYFDHEFPSGPGTEDLPLERAASTGSGTGWPAGGSRDDELNYRRFFDVDTLAASGSRTRQVFAATHALLLELVATGASTGLRIDHPDGLADPRGYLRRLRRGDRRRVGRRREDPRGRRAAARRLAVRGHDRLRRAAARSAACSSTRPAAAPLATC